MTVILTILFFVWLYRKRSKIERKKNSGKKLTGLESFMDGTERIFTKPDTWDK